MRTDGDRPSVGPRTPLARVSLASGDKISAILLVNFTNTRQIFELLAFAVKLTRISPYL
jgi:hypothetical protein